MIHLLAGTRKAAVKLLAYYSFQTREVSTAPLLEENVRFLLWFQGFHTQIKAAVKPLPLQFPRSDEVPSCTSPLKEAKNPSAGTLASGKAAVKRLVLQFTSGLLWL